VFRRLLRVLGPSATARSCSSSGNAARAFASTETATKKSGIASERRAELKPKFLWHWNLGGGTAVRLPCINFLSIGSCASARTRRLYSAAQPRL
jgi:hypothetical protein